MGDWARAVCLLFILAVVVLHTRHVLRTTRFWSQPKLGGCIRNPNRLTLAAAFLAGAFFLLHTYESEGLYSDEPWPRWVTWVFLFVAPGWTSWCLATLASLCVTAWRWRRGHVFK